MTSLRRFWVVVTMLVATAATSRAYGQAFFGGGTAFDPEISIAHSGTLLDAQVVVSEDRRYVTITARTSQSRLQDLFTFPVAGFQPAGAGGGTAPGGARLGFVGGAGFIDDSANNLPADVPKPEQSKESAERAAHAGRQAPIPKDPTSASPSEILKADPTAANSVLRKEGMFLLSTK